MTSISLGAILAVLALAVELDTYRSRWLLVFASRAMARAP